MKSRVTKMVHLYYRGKCALMLFLLQTVQYMPYLILTSLPFSLFEEKKKSFQYRQLSRMLGTNALILKIKIFRKVHAICKPWVFLMNTIRSKVSTFLYLNQTSSRSRFFLSLEKLFFLILSPQRLKKWRRW